MTQDGWRGGRARQDLAPVERSADLLTPSLALPRISATPIRRLLIIGRALHLAKNALALTELLEASHQLLNRFIGAGSNFNHVSPKLSSLSKCSTSCPTSRLWPPGAAKIDQFMRVSGVMQRRLEPTGCGLQLIDIKQFRDRHRSPRFCDFLQSRRIAQAARQRDKRRGYRHESPVQWACRHPAKVIR